MLLLSTIQSAVKSNIMTRRSSTAPSSCTSSSACPTCRRPSGQGRGNSGVYVQGRYEVQVLDSYGLKSKDNDCGGIYSVAAPLVNACKAPTVWQSYDIEFHAPKCEDGKKTEPAVMTVYHNGVKIHDNVRRSTTGQHHAAASAATPARPARSCCRTTATRCSIATSGCCRWNDPSDSAVTLGSIRKSALIKAGQAAAADRCCTSA